MTQASDRTVHDHPGDDVPPSPATPRARRGRLGLLLALATAAALIAAASWLHTATAPATHGSIPHLTGTTLTGTSFDLGTLRGHVVVVSFWGSWCGPCRAEAPDLARLATQSAGESVRFIGVDIRDDRAAALAFEHEYAVPNPSVYDADDSASAGFAPWPPVGTPTTYVIDTHGRIAALFSGRTRYTDLQPVVEQIVELG